MALNLRAFGVNTEEEQKKKSNLNLRAFGVEPEVKHEASEPMVSLPVDAPIVPQQSLVQPQQPPQEAGIFQKIKDAVAGVVKGNLGIGLPGLKLEQQKKIDDEVTQFAIKVAQSVPRSGVSTYLTATGQKEVTPDKDDSLISRAERILLGDEKIKDFQGTGEETITGVGGSEQIARDYGFAAGAALTTLDLIPGFPGKKKIVETLAKETSPEAIKKILKKEVFKDASDETLTALSNRLSTVNKKEDVQDVIDYFTKGDQTQSGIGLTKSSKEILQKEEDIITTPRQTPPQKKAELEAKGTEELQARQATADIAKESRSLFSKSQINDINNLKRVLRTKKVQGGDVETARKMRPDLVNRVIEFVREKKADLSDEDVISFVHHFPTKAETIAKTPNELVKARQLTKQVKVFTQGVREGKKYEKKDIQQFQKDLTNLLQELPISERGKLTYLASIRKATTPEKVSKEAEKINKALVKVDEARQLSKELGTRRSKIAFINKIGEFNATVVRDIKKQLDLKKPLKDMNEQELNQINASLLGRLKFKEERGFKVKGSESIEIVPTENVYAANRQAIAEGKKFGSRFSRGVKDAIKAPKETLDNLFGAVSTRLKNIDPSLKRQMRTFEYKVAKAKQADRRSVEPFVKRIKSKNMDASDYADLDLALKNGDSAKINTVLKKYGLEEDFAQVRQTLDNLYKRADEMGFDIGYRKNYTPRVITDPEGFLEYIQKGDDWSIVDEAIKAKEMELARYLTTEEKANLINTMVRGYKGGQVTLTETGAMKLRSIEVVDDKINPFYGDSVDSLLKYIDKTNDAIEARRFFGKVKNAEFTKIDDSIGKYILDLLADGKIKASQEKELRDILSARFNPVGTHGMWGTYKNLAYIDTMGSPISAITQIGDLAFAVYKGGPINAVKAFGRAVFGKSQITRKDIGIEKIATEFEDGSMTATLVDKVFKVVGLNKMDTLGKETVINAAIGKYRNLAKKPDQNFIDKLTTIYGNDEAVITRVIDDLKTGKITEDVKLLAFNELLDVQPVALSEMPVQYLKGGNGRVFYMLKTYTVKLFDVYRNEVWHEMVKDPKKGMRNLIYLTGTLALANATADEIKDMVLGRETSLEDRTVDNILKLAGFSKFTIYKARQEGAGSAISQSILPPMKLMDSITKDLTPKDDRELKDLESFASVPIGGKLYYWWFGKGAKKSEDKREKEASADSIDIPEVELPEIDIPEVDIPEI